MEIFKIVPLQLYEKFMKNDKTQDLTEDGVNANVSKIISMLKPKQQKRGEAILSLLVRNKTFSWNNDGEILYMEERIERGHILDLISFALNPFPSKRINIVGLSTFVQALKDLNIPQNLLSQQVYNMMVNEHSQETTAAPVEIKNDGWIRFKYD